MALALGDFPWDGAGGVHPLPTAYLVVSRLIVAEIATCLFFLQFAVAREQGLSCRREALCIAFSVFVFVVLCLALFFWTYWDFQEEF